MLDEVIVTQMPVTRRRILMSLKQNGHLTADELAQNLGITSVAVRRHLTNLERDRLVSHREIRRGMGRPSFFYDLTPQAAALFPRNYDKVATEVLETIRDLYGNDAVDAIFEKRSEELAEVYRPLMAGKTFHDRVQELVRLREEEGYMSSMETADDGALILREANCPIINVAETCCEACDHELALFVDLLDADVVRQDYLLNGDQACSYTVRPRGSEEA
jgi:iron-sulfur cluster biosynthesis transcriptional regulator SufR